MVGYLVHLSNTFVMRLVDTSEGENAVRGVGVDVSHVEREDRHVHNTSLFQDDRSRQKKNKNKNNRQRVVGWAQNEYSCNRARETMTMSKGWHTKNEYDYTRSCSLVEPLPFCSPPANDAFVFLLGGGKKDRQAAYRTIINVNQA